MYIRLFRKDKMLANMYIQIRRKEDIIEIYQKRECLKNKL